tara:strand:- start:380 stop:637 length:258 start_codon:yes stop_codon:yes gene_type:complete
MASTLTGLLNGPMLECPLRSADELNRLKFPSKLFVLRTRFSLLVPCMAGRDEEHKAGKTRVADSLATFEARVGDVLAHEGTFVLG